MTDERKPAARWLPAALLSISSVSAWAASQQNASLTFDPADFTTLHITVDGAPMEVRRYHVLYVGKPVVMAVTQPPRDLGLRGGPAGGVARGPASPPDPLGYQSMYIYVPGSAYENNRTAIIFQVGNSGWRASTAQDRVMEGDKFISTNDTDNTGAALKAGYVVVNAGTRSRGIKAADDTWAGKSPAVIVDAKAAIRYLRRNDAAMPGSAERIVITGTSGGGGLAVSVAASGNSPDYFPYLAEIGAAGIDRNGKSTIRDDVFATVAYCPVNDLGHADIAYEWQYNAVRTAANTTRGEYPADMQKASAALAAAYPAYLASLKLKADNGSPLTAAKLQQAIIEQIKKGVEAGIARGETIPVLGEDIALEGGRGPAGKVKNEWLIVENRKVKDIDYKKYLTFVSAATALKVAPAFDPSANTGNKTASGESSLFGPATAEYSNYAEFSWNHNDVKGDGSGIDDTGKGWAAYIAGPGKKLAEQIKMVTPLPYLNKTADSAPNWYFRHGLVDRDTSFAAQVTLYYALRNDPAVKDINFQLAWLKPHSGNYDVQEAYAWVAKVLARAGDPPVVAAR